jgi:hypothetical protein
MSETFVVNGSVTDVELRDPKYPNIKVRLDECDGNAFSILGVVTKALKENGVSTEERSQFMTEAVAGNYDHLLAVCMSWVNTWDLEEQ